MFDYQQQIVNENTLIREALEKLNRLATNLVLFSVATDGKLIGTVTDGDIRRALVNGKGLEDSLVDVSFKKFRFLKKKAYTLDDIAAIKGQGITLVPVLDEEGKIDKVLDLNSQKSFLPIEAVIMAGGKGMRLRPLTEKTPKPLLKVGEKPIMAYNVDRLADFGIDKLHVSINYLGQQIIDYFGDGSARGMDIAYIEEKEPLGTMGAISYIEEWREDITLVMNSDLLTNIDFEDFYKNFLAQDADMAVATIPYEVKVPYAVLETKDGLIEDFKEKPTYTYYSNAGIYLIKSELLRLLPKHGFYNATDFMERLIKEKYRVVSYPILGYWLDIGKHEDFNKAQEDVKHIKF